MTMYALIALFEIEINFYLLFLCNIFFIKIDQFLAIYENTFNSSHYKFLEDILTSNFFLLLLI